MISSADEAHAFERDTIHPLVQTMDTWLREVVFPDILERAYILGTLPLPPLVLGRTDGWVRGEPWYRGDLT